MAETAAQVEFANRNPNPSCCAIRDCPYRSRLLMVCGRCEKRYYCSIDHQMRDWPIHKRYCRVFVDPPIRMPFMIVQVPLTLPQRVQYAKVFIEELLSCVAKGVFPKKELEGVWGIEYVSLPLSSFVGMDYPVAPLVFNAWRCIFVFGKGENEEQFRNELLAALLNGGLVAYFAKTAKAIQRQCDYCSELVRRDFRGISWDRGMHFILAGKLHTGTHS